MLKCLLKSYEQKVGGESMKKIFTMATVAVLSLSLIAGCGTKATSSNAGGGEEIKIGGLFELTGGVAEFGTKGKRGAELAIEEQNAKGGVLNKKIKLVVADNKSDSGESTAQATKLVTQEKVTAILGPMTTGNTLAAINVVSDNKVPLITPSGTNAKLTIDDKGQLNKWIFRACFVDDFQGEVAANFALETLKGKKAAFIIDQKGDYAKGLAKAFEEVFTKAGGEIVAQEQYVADQDKDFKAILTRIKAKNPDVIYVPGYYKEVGLIIKQGREMEITAPFLGGDGWGVGNVLEIAGAKNMNKAYYSDHVATDDPALADFAKKYKEKYNQDVDGFAVLGYDSANMLIKAIETAGSTDTEKVRVALENLKGFKGVSGEMNVNPENHNPAKSAVVLEFKEGNKIFSSRVNPK